MKRLYSSCLRVALPGLIISFTSVKPFSYHDTCSLDMIRISEMFVDSVCPSDTVVHTRDSCRSPIEMEGIVWQG